MPILISYAVTHDNKLISIVSENMPHLKRGAMRDFENIMRMTGRWKEGAFNKQHSTYHFENGSKIEFFGADDDSKLRGARRNVLFINECNNVSYASYLQLAIRTSDFIYLDFNPVAPFYATEDLQYDEDAELIILTYKGNEGLQESVVRELEKNEQKRNASDFWENWCRVYIDGLEGQLTGAIYENYEIIEKLPKEAELLGYGLDWGFTADPTALIAAYRYNGQIIFDEVICQQGLTNLDISKKMHKAKVDKRKTIWCDSAEPKSIEDLRRLGWNAKPTRKGKDSIMKGIELLQRQDTFAVTERSRNIIRELKNYIWEKDKEGNTLNRPIDNFNHCFVGDTLVETITGLVEIKNIQVGDFVATPSGYRRVLEKWDNGEQQVYDYSMQFGIFSLSLRCTPDHRVYANGLWKEIGELKVGDRISLSKNLTEKLTISIKERGIFQKVLKGFTELFGSTIMERFQRTTTYTTLMGTLRTMLLRTLVSYIKTSTFVLKAKNGISQKKGVNVNSTVIPTVRLRRLDVEEVSTPQRVYDLTVEGDHCYYANGLLVHNCMDSIRYWALMTLRVRHNFAVV